ncbi:MAG: hypothetical protein HWN67_23100, partial [Candidatus Helarchaeota archaeon]|nr:hypothetical protein [Candidatus Helarchaeota archaeon]
MNPIRNKNIFYSEGIDIKEFREILRKDDIKLTKIQTITKNLLKESLSIFLVNNEFLKKNLKKLEKIHRSSDEIFFSIVLITENGTEPILDTDIIDDIIQMPTSKVIFLKKIKKHFSDLQLKYQSTILKNELELRTREIEELSRIGSMLMLEKDLDTLLHQILLKSREITNVDAGSLYLIEENEKKEKYLRFKLSQT